jgi:hypothetical protein
MFSSKGKAIVSKENKGKYLAKFKKIKINTSNPEIFQDRGVLSKELLSHKNSGFITLDTIKDPYLTLYSYETLRNFIKGLSCKTDKSNIVHIFNYDHENSIIPEEHNLEVFEFIKNFEFVRKYEEIIKIDLSEIVSRTCFEDNSETENIIGILEEVAPRVRYCEELHLAGDAPDASLIAILEMFKSKPKRIFYQKNQESENIRLR